jgi:hypothetical protein
MTPVEKLQAAIAKLEKLGGAESWSYSAHGIREVTASKRLVAPPLSSADMGLIVTLHHTIDAQLVLLRREISGLPEPGVPHYVLLLLVANQLVDPAVYALADAIIGGAE